MVEQAGHFHTHGFDPDLRPVAAVRARIDVAGGRIQQALAWARESAVLGAGGIDPAALSYLREYEHISVARVLLASHGLEVSAGAPLATELLELLLAAAVVGDRGRSVIEVLVLLAVARQLAGDEAGARQALERAVSLAEPRGIVRMFVDELPALEGLLRSLGEESGSARLARFCRELLTHTGTGAQETRPRDTRSAGTRPLDTDARSPDSITDRELEVLRLIAAGLSNHQIAQRLFRAESTIKGVNRVLFEKLGVQSRTEAIARARELGLLP